MTVAPPAIRRSPLPPDEGSIAALAGSFQRLLQRFTGPLLLILLLPALLIGAQHPERLLLYLVAVAPVAFLVLLSGRQSLGSLPVFALYLAIQALSFASPLLAAEINADRRVLIDSTLLDSCLVPLSLWFAALWLGWRFTPLAWGRRPPAPLLSQALRRPGTLPHWSLALASGLQGWISSPLYWDLLGPLAQGVLTPLRTLIALAGITGAFTGAYAWARGQLPRRGLWLILLLVPLLSSLSSLLLSSLQGMVFAALLGLWLGRARAALSITLASLLLLSFLNTGKYALRELYWAQGAPLPSNPIQLAQEWTAASLQALTNPAHNNRSNLFTDRFNNLQNLLYVQQQLLAGTPTLDGESLRVIPQVLLPRIFNSEKVRSQQGQVLLNLHFGRQRSLEDTEKAYIAWGFLAEGVGNFGSVAGPILMGIATGSLLRITENLGRGQWILSTPGLLSLALTLFWFTSYEMAASTFAAAAFQIVVVVLFVGWWFGRRPTRSARRFP